MAVASDFVQVAPHIYLWQTYDSAVKADLFSSAIVTADGIYLVDPIPLEPAPLTSLVELGPIAGIVLTNANHLRAAAQFAEQFSIPILARPESFPTDAQLDFRRIGRDTHFGDEFSVIEIEGAAPGELALYHEADGGSLVMGDALINFEPYGFTFLPGKYCSNEKRMRGSLRQLLAWETERMLFAHGTPILSDASERLAALLDLDA
ncbi:MAG: hypothetical protein ABI925_00200 [Verrucomicrobiota bacterium]